MLPVGLYFRLGCANRKQQLSVLPILLLITSKNILRTFEAEIFKLLKNIQTQPKIRRSYIYKQINYSNPLYNTQIH